MSGAVEDQRGMQGGSLGSLTRADINKVIMNYLITEGYQEASELFRHEADVQVDGDVTRIDHRVQIREAIQHGYILDAMQLIDLHYPNLLAVNTEVLFQLQLQHFIELVRQGQCEAALDFAQTHLANPVRQNPDMLARLERAMALLAFKDPASSAFGDVLLDSQRHKLASEVNAAILTTSNQPSTSKLADFYRLLLWMQSELDSKKVQYDCMTDIVSGQREPSD